MVVDIQVVYFIPLPLNPNFFYSKSLLNLIQAKGINCKSSILLLIQINKNLRKLTIRNECRRKNRIGLKLIRLEIFLGTYF